MRKDWVTDLTTRLRSNPTSFSFAAEVESDILAVEVYGELDMATGARLIDGLAPLVMSGVSVHLDLGGVSFMDSSGAGAISQLARMVDRVGGSIEIIECSQAVEWLLEFLGVPIPRSCVGAAIS